MWGCRGGWGKRKLGLKAQPTVALALVRGGWRLHSSFRGTGLSLMHKGGASVQAEWFSAMTAAVTAHGQYCHGSEGAAGLATPPPSRSGHLLTRPRLWSAGSPGLLSPDWGFE